MKTPPAKNYNTLSTLNQLCLPMDSGVLIPPDDPVRLPVFVLKRLDLTPLYEAYSAYRERRRREQAGREREAVERGAGKLIAADEGEGAEPERGDGFFRRRGRDTGGGERGTGVYRNETGKG
jgi:hypothetical protein